MALLAMVTLSAPGVDADRYFVPIHGHRTGDSYSYQPVYINKPHRSLRSTDSPKQGSLDDGENPQQHHHLPLKNDNLQGPRALAEADVASPVERALGQSPVTPAPTTTKHSNKATPAPTKTHTITVTLAPTNTKSNTSAPLPTTTKPKATSAATTTSTSHKKMHAPTANTPKSTPIVTKKTVVNSTPTPTAAKTKTTTPVAASSTNSNKPLSGAPQQQKSRNLGDNQAEQQPPHHPKHNDSPAWKDSGKQQ